MAPLAVAAQQSRLLLQHEDSETESSSGDATGSSAPSWRGPTLAGCPVLDKALTWAGSPVGLSLIMMLLWVLVGLVGLSHCMEEEETLSWIDQAFLMCQIITTVGYGDLPPPKTNLAFLFYAFYVLSALLIVAQAAGTFASGVAEQHSDAPDCLSAFLHNYMGASARFSAFVKAFLHWSAFCILWAVFFVVYPGEGIPPGEALYMGVITLTTVGFGDYVPESEGGKIFASVFMLLGTGAFTMMIGKFGVWSYFLFHSMSVDKLDTAALSKITETKQFKGVASDRAKMIEQLLKDFKFDKYKEVSNVYAEKISRNDFLMFMMMDMALVDVDMIDTLSSHFDELDITGEGYIDKEDLERARVGESDIVTEAELSRRQHSKGRRDSDEAPQPTERRALERYFPKE